MAAVVFIAFLYLGVASGVPVLDSSLDAEWQDWKIKYNKSYSLVGNVKTVQKGLRVNCHCCCKC